jgi:hypothetical protein
VYKNKILKKMNIPKLDENKCSVLVAELTTGHVFKKDLTLFLEGDNEGEVFQEFDNFAAAKDFAIKLINSKPQFECNIYDHNGKYLTAYEIGGERAFT